MAKDTTTAPAEPSTRRYKAKVITKHGQEKSIEMETELPGNEPTEAEKKEKQKALFRKAVDERKKRHGG